MAKGNKPKQEEVGKKEAKGSFIKTRAFRGRMATCTSYNLQRVEKKGSWWPYFDFLTFG